MPYKPKITTRSISTTTVTADSIPKNAPMTNNELDSNFLNIRDASIGIASDDSTVIDIGLGNTLKVAGGTGISTAVSGQTLTITGTAQAQGITFVGDDSTGTAIADGNTIKLVGQGGTTVGVSNGVITIDGGGPGSVGDLTISGTTISGPSNSNISIIPSGTGSVILDGLTITNYTISTGGALFVLDAGSSNIKMTDFLDMDSNKITGLATPTASTDATTKLYVDKAALTYDPITFTSGQPTTALYRNTAAYYKITLQHNGTISAFNNFSTGQTIVLLVVQDATGSRTLTFTPTIKWEGGSFPGLSTGANKRDIITIFHSGEADIDAYHASIRKDFA